MSSKRKPRSLVYVNILPETCEIICSGIGIIEFLRYTPNCVDNLIILKGDCIGNRRIHNFEMFEGRDTVRQLEIDNIGEYGEFCYADYSMNNNLSNMEEERIAELLYLAHMFKPIKSPFFKELNNQFVYLTHDNGWYCKIYCQDMYDFISVLYRKVTRKSTIKSIEEPSDQVKEQILDLALKGFILDINETTYTQNAIESSLYIVGEYNDMDKITNKYHDNKKNVFADLKIRYDKFGWNIS